jgi:hypothetical protein
MRDGTRDSVIAVDEDMIRGVWKETRLDSHETCAASPVEAAPSTREQILNAALLFYVAIPFSIRDPSKVLQFF